jgi:hypothetical protein
MKPYRKLAVLFAVAATVVIAVYLARTALAPMSAMIAKERNNLARSVDQDRALRDPAYTHAVEEKLHILGYRLAMAYNAENKPDKAIEVLRKLIDDERAREKIGAQRNSRSYLNESRYYEAMAESYELKEDENNANRARHERIKLLSKASELRKQENREEGRTVRSDVD